VAVFTNEGTFEFIIPDALEGSSQSLGGGDTVIAPMPGLVKQVNISAGQSVQEGDALIVLEAMKMEHTLTAPRDGSIKQLNVVAGSQVEDGTILIALEEADG